mgnify:CR=1 FL=1
MSIYRINTYHGMTIVARRTSYKYDRAIEYMREDALAMFDHLAAKHSGATMTLTRDTARITDADTESGERMELFYEVMEEPEDED